MTRPIGLLHGYLLEGSGSNLWTREMVRALCRAGETVHLVCQEPHPEDYDFVAEARVHEPDGTVVPLFARETAYPGRCLLHKPRLGDTLPVYVSDRYEEFARAVPMIELDDAAIEAYLAANVAVVERVAGEEGLAALHANHAVLMSVVAQRVAETTGLPFTVMPHGSAIEYAVKKDPRFHALAAEALGAAGRIFVHGAELRRRVLETFPERPELAEKIEDLPLGVDTAAFSPVEREGRAGRIAELARDLATLERGRRPEALAGLRARLDDAMERDELLAALEAARGYDGKLPDAGLEERLGEIDWARDEPLLFVGRLIAAKGPQSVVAALPLILQARPNARLLLVGHGPAREVLEALLWALETGARRLASNIVDWGAGLEGGAAAPFAELRHFFAALEDEGALDAYFKTAARLVRPESVLFAGYLAHPQLRHLVPCCDAAVFPSVVAEAGPLVFLEALAAGCFPLGTDFAGMAASIAEVAGAVPPEVSELMKLRADPRHTVADIAARAAPALALGGAHKAALRRAVSAGHDWTRVARKFARELAALAPGS